MDGRGDSKFVASLRIVSPGQGLREGLDRILQARMGALIVLGDGPEVLSICSGGFLVDAEFTPQKLYELAKMDGAIVLSEDGSRLARANVHLVPDPRLPTNETGTRHRTAERVARSVDVPVIAVSEELAVISVYRGGHKRQMKTIPTLLARAEQALSTLERYKGRLDSVLASLTSLEIRDETTFKDVLEVLQRAEMVRRISEEINSYLVELGADGRLLSLQLDELSLDLQGDYQSVITDFLGPCSEGEAEQIVTYISSLATEELLDTQSLSEAVAKLSKCQQLQADGSFLPDALTTPLPSKGQRMLSTVPHLPENVQEQVLAHFESLRELAEVSEYELAKVDGVGEEWAKAIKRQLAAEV